MFIKRKFILLITILIIFIFFIILQITGIIYEGYGVACEQFPFRSEVEITFKKHNKWIKKIENLNFIFVDIDTTTCPTKAGIVINYNTIEDKKNIKHIIQNKTFFLGIPYKMINR